MSVRRSEPSPDWDAATYDRIADPMARWGGAVLDRLPLSGDETVLDAGCGSGRVTELLLERLPHGCVVALDRSSAMLAMARERLPRERVRFVQADLDEPLAPVVGARVDAVFSTATFHWIADHERLFANLAAVMRAGAPLVAQCGGVGNIASVRSAVERVAGRWAGSTHFATPDETEARLRAAGFDHVRAWLQDEPTPLEPGEPFETYLRTICLRGQMDGLDRKARAIFAREVAATMPDPSIDYVRLNIDARRS
jgi:trans-aconitate 2-methyltransferase